MGEHGDHEGRLRNGVEDVAADRAQVAALGDAGLPGNQPVEDGQERRDGDRGEDEERPRGGRGARHGPRAGQRQERAGGRQGAAQIVRHLPAPDQGNPCPEDPRQELPVAAGPAMLAGRGYSVVRGRALEELDVGGQSGAREQPLEKIVAQQGVFRHAPGQGRFEGVDVVDPLARVRPLAEEILVDVGRGGRVRVDTGLTGRKLLEDGALPPRERRGDPRLQQAISLDDAAGGGIEAGPIERVGHRADQSIDGAPRLARIRIQGDDVPNIRRCLFDRVRGEQKGGVARSSKQAVQLMKLPALALPSHPDAFTFVPEPAAMKEKESVAAVRRRTVALVQSRDALARRGQENLIIRHGFLGCVRPVGEDAESEVTVGVRQVVHFQPLHLLVDFGAGGEQGGHDHHGAEGPRHTIAKLESRQRIRLHHRRHEAIHEHDGQIRRRYDGEEAEHDEHAGSHAGGPCHEKRQGEDGQGEQADRPEVSERCPRDIGAEEPAGQRGAAAEDRFQPTPSRSQQIEPGIVPAAIVDVAPRRLPDGFPSHVELAAARASRELLDGMAVAVARGEVHGEIVDVRLKHAVDQADALEELIPLQRGHQAHAHDHVPDGDVHGGLPLVLDADDLVGRRPLGGEALVQPYEGGGHRRILVTEPLNKLHREGRSERPLLELLEGQGSRPRVVAAHSEEIVGEGVRGLARRTPTHDALRESSKILHQHHPQGDGDRPQLADGQRLDALIGQHESAEQIRIEATVRVRDKGPGDAVDTRIADKGPVGQLGQLPVEARRQIVADLAQLLIHDVEVVDEPFRRGHDRALFADCLGHRAIRLAQDAPVVLDAREQRTSPHGSAEHRLGGRQALRVLLEALDPEELRPDRLLDHVGSQLGAWGLSRSHRSPCRFLRVSREKR